MFKLGDKPKTKEDYYTLCVEMWNEIAEENLTCKYESQLAEYYLPMGSCFACEYHFNVDHGERMCAFGICAGEYEPCMRENHSPYNNWWHSPNIGNAIAIADLFITALEESE